MNHRAVLATVVFAAASLGGTLGLSPTHAAATAPSAVASGRHQCPGAAFQFPVDGYVGWIWKETWLGHPEPSVLATDHHPEHTGVDVWAPGGAGAAVYPPASGSIAEIGPHSVNLWLPGVNGGTSVYLTHIQHSFGPGDVGRSVDPATPIGTVYGAQWIHMSVNKVNGPYQHHNDNLIDQTQDPSPYFAARLNFARGDASTFDSSNWASICDATRVSFPVVTKPGSVTTITKTILTSAIPPKPDVVFLADTTGSMSGAISSVQVKATDVMNLVVAAQPNARFGVAEYKDFGCDANPYLVDQSLTASIPDAQASIDLWGANGGCDDPEAQLNALFQLATDTSGVGWRSDSTRIVVWFGDAPGHDPSNGVTLADAISALQGSRIRVIAIDVANLDATGQAQAITAATAGTLLPIVTPAAAAAGRVNPARTRSNATSLRPSIVSPADAVSDAILQGLTTLPATIQPIIPDCGPYITVTPDAPSKTVTSGQPVSFTFTVTVAEDMPIGASFPCEITFQENGVEIIDSTVVEPLVVDAVAPSGSVARVSGSTVYAAAAAVSRVTYPTGVPVVYIASGTATGRDAVAAAAASGYLGGPVLLVTKTSVPAVTATELKRLKPARIVVLGTSTSVSATVVNRLRAYVQ